MNRNVVLCVLGQRARELQMKIPGLKWHKGYHWAKAIPDTPLGKANYNSYCYYRTTLIKLRKELKQINAAIKAIKRGEV